jgi:hypothetical protein
MNEATALGLYASVSKLLPGSELPFPGCKAGYFAFNTWTSSNLHAKFCLWAATAPGVGNNIFNVTRIVAESLAENCKAVRVQSPRDHVPAWWHGRYTGV